MRHLKYAWCTVCTIQGLAITVAHLFFSRWTFQFFPVSEMLYGALFYLFLCACVTVFLGQWFSLGGTQTSRVNITGHLLETQILGSLHLCVNKPSRWV